PETDQTSPEKETPKNEEGKNMKEVGTSEDNPTPTASQKNLVDSHLPTDSTKGNETQAQPNNHQVEDPSPQKDTEGPQPNPDQNKPEVEVPTVTEEKTPIQVESHGTSVIEASSQGPLQDMAQHNVIIADPPC
ncbi:hypothetical protein A2U01_0053020, partial [Trifolium medium]|nr:hypothetical protein [Trifolium medium]